jgi:Arc/MetJ family transcription regulator
VAVVKKSVTLDEELVAEAQEYLGEGGLSQLVNEGLRRQVLVERARRAVAEHEAEHGTIPDDALADVDAQWPR